MSSSSSAAAAAAAAAAGHIDASTVLLRRHSGDVMQRARDTRTSNTLPVMMSLANHRRLTDVHARHGLCLSHINSHENMSYLILL